MKNSRGSSTMDGRYIDEGKSSFGGWLKQWWNVTKNIYSSAVFNYNLKYVITLLAISILQLYASALLHFGGKHCIFSTTGVLGLGGLWSAYFSSIWHWSERVGCRARPKGGINTRSQIRICSDPDPDPCSPTLQRGEGKEERGPEFLLSAEFSQRWPLLSLL